MTTSRPQPVQRPVDGAADAPPLFLPDEPFPPYRFVPGHTPHPYKQEGGWAFGESHAPPAFVSRDDWRDSPSYLRGLDFFNRGWWWEAHEEWESLWHVCRDRDEVQFDLLKGLIQLAACALNVERGHAGPAARLLVTAVDYLGRARAAGGDRVCGLELEAVRKAAEQLLGRSAGTDDPRAINGFYLRPE